MLTKMNDSKCRVTAGLGGGMCSTEGLLVFAIIAHRCVHVTVELSAMLPEGGRDHLAKLFYHPIFAEGERRASLGNLFMETAAAGQEAQHAAERARGQCNSTT